MSSLELTYRSFITRISDTGRKDLVFTLFKRILIMLIIFIALAFLFITAEAVFELSTTFRKILFFGYISGFAATAVMISAVYLTSLQKIRSSAVINRYAKKDRQHLP